LSPPLAENNDIAHQLQEALEEIGNFAHLLIGVQVFAGLFHRLITRGKRLARMLLSQQWVDRTSYGPAITTPISMMMGLSSMAFNRYDW
jgi:hypothetical protein